MDSISSIASISRLLRSKKAKNDKQATAKTRNKNGITEKPTENSPSEYIASAISELPSQKQTGDEGIKILIHGIINWKFGENAMEDPLIRRSVDKTMVSILEDRPSKKATQNLIKEILKKNK